MKLQWNRTARIAAFAALALAVATIPASAQSASAGRFSLTHEVQWQGAKLEPGDYTFNLESTAAPSTVIVRGPNGAIFEMAKVANRENSTQPSALNLERIGGVSYVRSLFLSDLGITLVYSAPRMQRDDKVIAQGPAQSEQILVALARK